MSKRVFLPVVVEFSAEEVEAIEGFVAGSGVLAQLTNVDAKHAARMALARILEPTRRHNEQIANARAELKAAFRRRDFKECETIDARLKALGDESEL